MKKWFKELFCSHIYKVNEAEYLGIERFEDDYPSSTYSTFQLYAIHQTCIKCGKAHIRVKRKLVI